MGVRPLATLLLSTMLALAMTIPPLIALIALREAKAYSAITIIAWLLGTIVWMLLVVYIFVSRRGKGGSPATP